jgi:hypothetical protein
MSNFSTTSEQLIGPQRIIRMMLENGSRITVAQGNRVAQTTETRKIVSRLREQGIEVKDFWMVKDGRRFKYYYIDRPLAAKGSKHDVLQAKLEIQ